MHLSTREHRRWFKRSSFYDNGRCIEDFNDADDDNDDVEATLFIHNEKLHTSEVEDVNNHTQDEEENDEENKDLVHFK